ncbi:hypothetical protein C8F04DRAFT_1177833 [Mycena alexandri]|uniref:Uncharacterized protein n=1 Tax=Mycena alexandri TaxID=1745969 RepID=A0AAD6T796_9AGAR|nr:hypothetical protein C8F04DRAFT_1177833 [Mycena alexandri]
MYANSMCAPYARGECPQRLREVDAHVVCMHSTPAVCTRGQCLRSTAQCTLSTSSVHARGRGERSTPCGVWMCAPHPVDVHGGRTRRTCAVYAQGGRARRCSGEYAPGGRARRTNEAEVRGGRARRTNEAEVRSGRTRGPCAADARGGRARCMRKEAVRVGAAGTCGVDVRGGRGGVYAAHARGGCARRMCKGAVHAADLEHGAIVGGLCGDARARTGAGGHDHAKGGNVLLEAAAEHEAVAGLEEVEGGGVAGEDEHADEDGGVEAGVALLSGDGGAAGGVFGGEGGGEEGLEGLVARVVVEGEAGEGGCARRCSGDVRGGRARGTCTAYVRGGYVQRRRGIGVGVDVRGVRGVCARGTGDSRGACVRRPGAAHARSGRVRCMREGAGCEGGRVRRTCEVDGHGGCVKRAGASGPWRGWDAAAAERPSELRLGGRVSAAGVRLRMVLAAVVEVVRREGGAEGHGVCARGVCAAYARGGRARRTHEAAVHGVCARGRCAEAQRGVCARGTCAADARRGRAQRTHKADVRGRRTRGPGAVYARGGRAGTCGVDVGGGHTRRTCEGDVCGVGARGTCAAWMWAVCAACAQGGRGDVCGTSARRPCAAYARGGHAGRIGRGTCTVYVCGVDAKGGVCGVRARWIGTAGGWARWEEKKKKKNTPTLPLRLTCLSRALLHKPGSRPGYDGDRFVRRMLAMVVERQEFGDRDIRSGPVT